MSFLDDFGTQKTVKNKEYWKQYFRNTPYHKTEEKALDPIRQIDILETVGQHNIYYWDRQKKNANEIVMSLMKKTIELEEL